LIYGEQEYKLYKKRDVFSIGESLKNSGLWLIRGRRSPYFLHVSAGGLQGGRDIKKHSGIVLN
jgi:hypothetical protein